MSGEIRKTRPGIIVSNDTANAALNRMQVVRLTGNTAQLYPAQAFIAFEDGRRSL